jgi:hypothetical protein
MAKLRPAKRKYRELAAKLRAGLKQNLRLARALPEFFRRQITLAQAEEEIERRLESRAESFLQLARTRIYGRADSPYLKLLKIAGCDFADLETHVRRDGLEAALADLARAGVYLTADEFKGKKEVCRGRESFRVSLGDLEPAEPSPGFMGAAAAPQYGFSDGGSVGMGCGNPLVPDDVQVNQHTFAVIPHPRPLNRDGAPIRPLLYTTLLPMDPRQLLNVENGDYGILEERDCGCALGKVGLTQHLHRIRSYEKFTSEGMNYFYGDLYDLFEKILPLEFGGGPGDYQLVEEEDENGQTQLTLRVHPDVSNLDEAALIRRLQQELAKGLWGREFQTKIWQDAGTFRIRREAPHSGARGKILPLHMARL